MKKLFGMGVLLSLFTLTASLFSACENESLEDTYSEYAGDGEIRYIGSITDLEIRSGWHRLEINWHNSIDPIIDSVLVTWEKDDVVRTKMLPRTDTILNITGLEDGRYSVTVQSVDGKGRKSQPKVVYGRPYTLQHEAVMSVTQLVTRTFFLHDRLIMIFLGWEDNIDHAYVTYTKKGAEACDTLQLTKQMVNGLYYLVPGELDITKPVTLYREGYIPGCEDYVVFSPVQFDDVRIYNGDFKREMKRQFGFQDEIPEAWADTVSTISFDWNISSFVDLFNFPNLKTIVLGKHRYIIDEKPSGTATEVDAENSKRYAHQTETLLSKFVLKTLYQLQKTQVQRYADHYSELGTATYIKKISKTSFPTDVQLYNLAQSGVYFYDNVGVEGWNNHIEYLVDGNANTNWECYQLTASTPVQFMADLGSSQTAIKGLMWVQPYFNSSRAQERAKIAGSCQVLTSIDGVNWDYATYVEDYTLGESTGETNLIYFRDGGIKCRYIAVFTTTPLYYYNYCLSVAELGLW